MKKNLLKTVLLTIGVSTLVTSCNNDDSKPWELPEVSNSGIKLPYTVLRTTEDNVEIRNGGFGSAATAHPTNEGEFYALTDRGANISFGSNKIFPTPDYTPRIGHFKLTSEGTIEKVKEILFKDPSGNLISGRPNAAGYGATGEIAYDEDQTTVLATDNYGLDSEGLVAMKDGSFWVSDEYGPHVAHFDAEGNQLERLSPKGINGDAGDRKLPAVFATRWANRGMEGLAITPDEKTLVGIMQSTLYNPSKADVADFTITRIVTFDIATGATKQYLHKQEKAKNSNSEIVALSNTEFLIVERDGAFTKDTDKGTVQKHIYKIDISNATDVSDSEDSANGKLIDGKTIEQCTWSELETAGILPATKTLAVDLIAVLGDYPHDKLEGIWLINDSTIGVINDDDFAVWTGENSATTQKYISGTETTENIDGNTLYIVNF
ncbi:esterase-like activity of phytase family protein [Wenyingzhuangia sp. 2_MG-2023]|uniref:esterase-like activity of phytase family protein n=1 Tax=Wenyingzhuangia sp. 2_MG-2023 TaxID=3062639 RepID=UPI0026E26FA1|nr:esterase-like activity of phytase family protein [Wenyingzhuangia sp. 2_MG-2023]MDO6736644.1 esterase-like activity of phytase family protein [Wenyingzhuangia sp. 2_MG-2023]